MGWDQAISEYVRWLQAARRSPGTIRLYRHYVRQLETIARRPDRVSTRDVEAFVARYAAKAGDTHKSARQVARSFFGWAVTHGVVAVDPSAGLPSVHVPTRVPRPMPERLTVTALITAPQRERRMVLLARYAGLRAGEVSAVHSDDWLKPWLLVHGKGAKEREVPIVHPELVDVLDALDGWLFPNTLGGHLAPATVATYMGALFPPGWSAHRLRTAFATEAYRRNPDLLALARLMGHARTETTQRYVRLDDEAALRLVEAAYGPVPPARVPGTRVGSSSAAA